MARSSIDPLKLVVNLCIQSAKMRGDNPDAISKDVIAKINELPDAEKKLVQKKLDALIEQPKCN